MSAPRLDPISEQAIDWMVKLRAGQPDPQLQERFNAWLAQDLSPDKLAQKPFSPLPVLGVPGWWAANEVAAFYDDTAVFRPKRLQRTSEKPYAAEEIDPSV